ncbi:hypothetical protein [uncultured Nevskia sp.]|uniref:hypothetical protein n=1 Tax=uncultured Nevskia sp. TaxID=228950 RepID=UPI0025D46888|nr:hypothetical protein [uncultured Nevskia sp.]
MRQPLRCSTLSQGLRPILGSLLAALLLSACTGNSNDDGGLLASPSSAFSLFDPTGASNTAAPGSAIIPFPFDGLFAGALTPTLNIPLPDPVNLANPANALVQSANLQDGWSTTASIFTDFAGFVDFATVPAGLLIINGSTGQPLVYGSDFTVQSSTAIPADGVPINQERTRLLIEPLKPLAPSTTYIVALTPTILSRDGLPIVSSDYFRAVRSATPVAEQTGNFAAALTPTQIATLEAIRLQLVRPLVAKLTAPPALGGVGLSEEQIVLAWTFTTQSIDNALRAVAARAAPGLIAVAPTGLSTLALGGFGLANIYAGLTTVPYYLNSAGTPADPQSLAPLTGYWRADSTQPANAAFAPTALSAQPLPCAAFAPGNGLGLQPSASTTGCFPIVDTATASTQSIPVLVTVPSLASGLTKPVAGWPVVIFQHGITRNRADVLAVADTLARAGFVAVAIDLPLHGITPPDPLLPQPADALYRNALFTGSPAAGLITGERSFDLDLQNNASGAPGPDGLADPSGTWFINLPSLVTSRDNIRQAVADLLTLEKTVAGLDLDGDGVTDVDTTQLRFFGHSLGAIVGTTFLGVSANHNAAVLANGGGGIGKLLDGSAAFGPRISAGLLASAGIAEGSDNYETFTRFAQTLVDSGDPQNYAVAARAAHPIYASEVIGDGVVPNVVVSNCSTSTAGLSCSNSASADRVLLAGLLSGTEPLLRTLGLQIIGPLIVPYAAQAPLIGTDLGVAVQFADGNHGSILDPGLDATSAAVTCEMQRQAASFLASNGTALPLGGSCP